jgi:hypothetical protein
MGSFALLLDNQYRDFFLLWQAKHQQKTIRSLHVGPAFYRPTSSVLVNLFMTSDVTGLAMSTNKFDRICNQPNNFEGCLQVVGDNEFR